MCDPYFLSLGNSTASQIIRISIVLYLQTALEAFGSKVICTLLGSEMDSPKNGVNYVWATYDFSIPEITSTVAQFSVDVWSIFFFDESRMAFFCLVFQAA